MVHYLRMGYMANLYTIAEHRGHGCGRLAVSALARHARLKLGLEAFTYVLKENQASLRLFKRCGFEIIDDAVFINVER